MSTNEINTEAYWMPFTANRAFKKNPRIIQAASGMYYETRDGDKILDGCAGLWCVNAGHGNEKINEAIKKQVDRMTYSPAFQAGHPLAFEFAEKLADLFPGDLNHVFYTNSGSESVETALKISRAYHKAAGKPEKIKFIGREKGYHGVNFGGLSVGGIMPNRHTFGPLLPEVDHLPHTHDLAKNAFSKGQPEHGADKADRLLDLIALHGAHTIAAVIVEPMAGSAGVLIPPQGYLEKLRRICTDHDILLIFDEVITAFGRLGDSCAASLFGIQPDLITTAKGLTNGAVPMGAVMVSDKIHDALMTGPENMIELFHGYTYSGHPLACAAGIASLEVYAEENLFSRARDLAPYWQKGLHSLKRHECVIDVRDLGLVGAIELRPREGQPTVRAFEAYMKAFETGLLIRTTADIIALSPPLIISEQQIDFIVNTLDDILAKI
ncbi:aspartate aminotransferase family protein [Emcibacter sp.]|uniref:aspartate aminotransferase family protein n=1 Tax=Emcibacter sp. TaxID=1979954 RepID=UPI002AA69906|nr:aspartate aminotransferase family protein [Emcibacter sp.]